MSLPTRVFDGVALVTRTKAVCQAVWPVWHALFVTGQPRRFRDDFTLEKALNVLPGSHTLTTRVTMCGTGHTGFRRCGQCHILEGCLSNGVAGAAFRANLEGPRGQNHREKPWILTSASFIAFGATRPAVPTLPSRAHLQD